MTAADLAGAAGFVLVALWPWLSGRRALLAGRGASAAAFSLHYLLIGATTGAALAGLSGFCWVAHDLLTGSAFGLAADLLCMAGLVYGGLRERRNSPPGGGFSPVSAKT